MKLIRCLLGQAKFDGWIFIQRLVEGKNSWP